MNYTKHCDLLRQTCPEPMLCGNGCQCVKAELPMSIQMLDKPYQWLQELFHSAIYVVGLVSLAAGTGTAIGYFYVRWFV